MDSAHRSKLYEIARDLEALASSPARAQEPASTAPDLEFSRGLVRLHQSEDTTQIAQYIARLGLHYGKGRRSFVMLVTGGQKLRFAAGENITAQELAEGAPVARELIQQSLVGSDIVADDYQDHAAVCIPVLAFASPGHDSPPMKLGVLYIDRGPPQTPVDEATLELLEAIVDHGASALVNQRRLVSHSGQHTLDIQQARQLQRLKASVAKLCEIGQDISAAGEPDDLLDKIVDSVVEISDAQRGFIMLVEHGEPVYKTGRSSDGQAIPRDKFSFSRSVTHKTITDKSAQLLVCQDQQDFNPSRSMVALDLRSVMCVPLIAKGEVLGVIYLDSMQEAKEFDQLDLDFLKSLSGQATIALVNARLTSQVSDKSRVSLELATAADIQRGLLPRQDPEVEGLEVRGLMIPAKEIGGDYYDFIAQANDAGSLTMAIGDVAGKGVGAGLIAMMARSIIRSAIYQSGVAPQTCAIMRNVNTMLCEDLLQGQKGMFMTLNILNWTAETNTLRYCSAGHEHVLIYRASSREVESFLAGGTAAGVSLSTNPRYQEQSIQLQEGDQVLLYTDGVTEAMNSSQEEWSLERLIESMNRHGDKTPLDLINAVSQEVKNHIGLTDQSDDITLLAMKAKPRLFNAEAASEMESLLGWL
jgi:phosphoserine phosphatase RsbU/P